MSEDAQDDARLFEQHLAARHRDLTESERDLTQEQRAAAAIFRVQEGANPTLEALVLANRYSEEKSADLRARLRRLFRR